MHQSHSARCKREAGRRMRFGTNVGSPRIEATDQARLLLSGIKDVHCVEAELDRAAVRRRPQERRERSPEQKTDGRKPHDGTRLSHAVATGAGSGAEFAHDVAVDVG